MANEEVIEATGNVGMDQRNRSGASVALEKLDKRFNTVVAVDGVSLAIEPGEFITLLGPSGSGKTTTLMMIAGFEIPTAGEIYIDGVPIVTTPPHRRNIGMVFQNYALFPHMTVAENIAFPLKQRKVPKASVAQRVAGVLDIVSLPGYEGRYPRQLSGGQQQRVALARAIVFNPRVLLMDEPLGALDKKLREGLQLEIRRLHEELGITFIYVTHDQEEALVMSDRIAVMNQGRIEQLGSPVDLYDRPNSRFVAEFIGESNFLEGMALDGGSRVNRIRVGDDVVSAIGREDVASGMGVVLAVRPEKLSFREEREALPLEQLNHLATTVREGTFIGEMRRYVVETAAGLRLTLKQPLRYGIRHYEPGDEVELEWHVEDTRIVSIASS
jgi:putative spermidine/putrescine transport system ATP-binding protein